MLSVGAEAGHQRGRVAAARGALREDLPDTGKVALGEFHAGGADVLLQTGGTAGARDRDDVLALINQIAMTWAGQPEIAAAAAVQAVDPSVTARRAALVTAVERMFPRPDRDQRPNRSV